MMKNQIAKPLPTRNEESAKQMTWKNKIFRNRVHQEFKPTQFTHKQLYAEDSEISVGPNNSHLFEDESADDVVRVSGGDGSAPYLRDFSGILPALVKNLEDRNIRKPTPVQKTVIPTIIAKRDYDLVACAETGSGKTGSFLFPIIHLLEKENQAAKQTIAKTLEIAPKAIIITPLRELAEQIGKTAKTFTRDTSLRVVTTYGEIKVSDSLAEMREGCDILVTCLGRLMQFVYEKKLQLTRLRFLVLDEADRLIRESQSMDQLLELKQKACPHRTFMFSATFGPVVEQQFAQQLLRPGYFFVAIDRISNFGRNVEQHLVEVKTKQYKSERLLELLAGCTCGRVKEPVADEQFVERRKLDRKVLVFCNSRRRANRLAFELTLKGYKTISHTSERTQAQRQTALEEFRGGYCDILVSTALERGMNLSVRMVVNYDLPTDKEMYIHRIGRTGRMGNTGDAISFVDMEQPLEIKMADELEEITRSNGRKISRVML